MKKKIKDCKTCSKMNCNICINRNEWEEKLDIRKELKGKPCKEMMDEVP